MSTRAEVSEVRGAVAASRTKAWVAAFTVPAVLALPWCYAWSRGGFTAPPPLGTFSGLVVLLLVGVTSYTDIRGRRIPNWATYPAMLWALLINSAASLTASNAFDAALGAVGFLDSVAGLLVLFALMFCLFSLTGRGAGDVKLAASLGALMGLERGLYLLAFSFIFSGA